MATIRSSRPAGTDTLPAKGASHRGAARAVPALVRGQLALALLLFGCAPEPPAARYSAGSATSVDASAVELVVLRDEVGGIEAAIAPEKGGELSGLRLRHGNGWIETLQLARDYAPREGFGGKGPLLWPATGRSFPPDLEARRQAGEAFDDGAYDHAGVRRPMPIHGFARDLPWTLEEASADGVSARARLSLADTEATRAMYPFGFRCEVEYAVLSGRLELRYSVVASSGNSEPMFFSIGNHITFVAPLVAGGDAAQMVLESPAATELLKTAYGIPTGEARPAAGFAGGLPLGEYPPLVPTSLADFPAGQDPHVVYRDPAGLAIRISHSASHVPESPVVQFNLWGDVRRGFFSPEPWIGLQNSLVSREGLVFLQPGEVFRWTVRISHESAAG